MSSCIIKANLSTNKDILASEYSTRFDELRQNRMIMSYHKYGAARLNYDTGCCDAIKSLEERLKLYKETGNTEWLVDVANFAMLEYMYPQHKKAHFRATSSDESPGVVGVPINEEVKQ